MLTLSEGTIKAGNVLWLYISSYYGSLLRLYTSDDYRTKGRLIITGFIYFDCFMREQLAERGIVQVGLYQANTPHQGHDVLFGYVRYFLEIPVLDCVWNVMAHAQKPDFVFRRNGRVHLNRQGRQFSRLLSAEFCASALVMLDTPRSEVVWRVLATHSIRQFPLHFPSRASPCAIRFQTHYTNLYINDNVILYKHDGCVRLYDVYCTLNIPSMWQSVKTMINSTI